MSVFKSELVFYERQPMAESYVWRLGGAIYGERRSIVKDVPVLYFEEREGMLMLITSMHYPDLDNAASSTILPSNRPINIFVNKVDEIPKYIQEFLDELKQRGKENNDPIYIDITVNKDPNLESKDYPFTLRVDSNDALIIVHRFTPLSCQNPGTSIRQD